MSFRIGSTEITGLRVGNSTVAKLYRGASLIFGGAAPAWSPAELFAASEQGIWLDPSDLSTVFTDTAGTTPATVGQAVARINDKSGRGNHATQATTARRPILRQDSGGLYYLEFDGVDDSMSTPTITPGTDKAQVFVGVRKLSDAAVGMIIEHSVNRSTNAGAFDLRSSANTPASYSTVSRGDAVINASQEVTRSGFAAPHTAVLAALHDIPGDSTTLDVNGTSGPTATGDKGAGNFLAYPLFIGARNNEAVRFNGRIYSLIARFGPNLTSTKIDDAEAWVAAKTGVTL
jgi:hypothetical protein